jgi:hypothetical protein
MDKSLNELLNEAADQYTAEDIVEELNFIFKGKVIFQAKEV